MKFPSKLLTTAGSLFTALTILFAGASCAPKDGIPDKKHDSAESTQPPATPANVKETLEAVEEIKRAGETQKPKEGPSITPPTFPGVTGKEFLDAVLHPEREEAETPEAGETSEPKDTPKLEVQ